VDTTPTRRRLTALITALALGGGLAACDDRTNTETSNPASQDPQSEGVDVGTNPAQTPGDQTGDQGELPGAAGDEQEGENTP
jgi:hypothetical protein